jgi:two-component system sensor histidine kinase TctE
LSDASSSRPDWRGDSPLPAAHARSLRGRLLGLLLAPLSVLLLTGLLVAYIAGVAPLRQSYDQLLSSTAIAVAAHVKPDGQGGAGLDWSDEAAASLQLTPGSGRRFAVRIGATRLLAGDATLAAVAGPSNPALGDIVGRDGPMRACTYRTKAGGMGVIVTVAETLERRERASRYLVMTTVTLAAVQLVSILFLVWLAVRRGLEPLQAVQRRLAAGSARDIEPIEERAVPEEVRGLVAALNELFARVRSNAEAQQRFLADAAHQLRTPLAGMQAQLELLLNDPAAAALKDRLGPLHDSTRRLAHTANQLLTLARAEASATTGRDFGSVDLKALAEQIVLRETNRAVAAGIDLGVELAAASAHGVEWLIRELLANLVDNALRYAGSGGVVTVRCHMEGRRPVLEVEDDGPGIPVEERQRVLQRFYRPKGTPGVGSGLGLAIVDDVVRLHGGELELGDARAGRGLRVRVTFKAA